MIQDFETWSAPRAETNSFDHLKDAVLAIDASFYLDRLLSQPPSKEPLLSALGGLPFALKAHIENELGVLQNNGITPLFVFNGMDVGKKDDPFRASDEAARLTSEAWELYNQHQAERAVDTFGSSGEDTWRRLEQVWANIVEGYAQPEDYYRLLQSVLHKAKVQFLVAPYAAWGQLAYLANDGSDFVDAIAGSTELLLFDVDRIIMKLDFERQEFTFVRRRTCVEDLGLTSSDMFLDACLLSGSDLLPTLPTLHGLPARSPPKIRAAVDVMRSNGQSGVSVCTQLREHPAMRGGRYADRFKKSRLAVKHHIVLTQDGKVGPFEPDNIPNDLHEVIGHRLPEELYYYLSVGAIGPRVLNQLTSAEVNEIVPPDGGNSEEYHALVSEGLNPIRSITFALLAHSLTRAYQHMKVDVKCWFDRSRTSSITISDVVPPKPTIDGWNVHESVFKDHSRFTSDELSLAFAVGSLSDSGFAAKTVAARDHSKPLVTKLELGYNSIWRFLHLRGYLNERHELTPWGTVLDAALSNLGPETGHEEAAMLAVELLRLDLLNARSMFPSYSGAPIRGSDLDKRNTLLVSRVACLGKLRHKSIGFTGPLSRHLLGYSSIISAVRRSLRDLLEMSFATMMLNGDAEREGMDLGEVGLDLPFLLPLDCSLGIAMKHYLDELSGQSDPTSLKAHEDIKEKGPKEWFPHAEDFRGDLQEAFMIWDAVYAAVKVGLELDLIKDKETWAQVGEWVRNRK